MLPPSSALVIGCACRQPRTRRVRPAIAAAGTPANSVAYQTGVELAGNNSSGGPLSPSQNLAEAPVHLIPGRDPVSIRFGDQLIAVLPRLRRFARGLTGSAVEADDLVQAACERALARQHPFQEGT